MLTKSFRYIIFGMLVSILCTCTNAYFAYILIQYSDVEKIELIWRIYFPSLSRSDDFVSPHSIREHHPYVTFMSSTMFETFVGCVLRYYYSCSHTWFLRHVRKNLFLWNDFQIIFIFFKKLNSVLLCTYMKWNMSKVLYKTPRSSSTPFNL